ncbi:MAG: hypothetical protein WCQ95_08255 [Bacteroidota bacterium]
MILYIGAQFGGFWGAGASCFYIGLKYVAGHQDYYEYHLLNGEINPGMQFIFYKE